VTVAGDALDVVGLDVGGLVAPVPLAPERHPAVVYLASLPSTNSKTSMRWALRQCAALLGYDGPHSWLACPWHSLRYAHTAQLRSKLMERYSVSSVRAMLSAIKGVLRECWRLGLLASDDYQRAVDLPALRGSRLPRGRSLTARELHDLFASVDQRNPQEARDGAILAVMAGGGLRRHEMPSLDVESYQEGALRVLGKGQKERLVPLPRGARDALDCWLDHRGREPGPLFWALPGTRRLGLVGVEKALRRLRLRAPKVEVFKSHDCRRTFATALFAAGNDTLTVQRLLGHADPKTTAIYDRRGDEALRTAANTISIPFERTRTP